MARKSSFSGPGDAIGALSRLLNDPDIYIRAKDLAADTYSLREVYRSDDDAYTSAIAAIILQIQRALKNPTTYGRELEHNLAGIRRGKFAPLGGRATVLRLVEQPYRGGIYILAIRHRHEPAGTELYPLVTERLTQILKEC